MFQVNYNRMYKMLCYGTWAETYRTFAKVWRRFFKYRLWYFCSSPIEPCSACIFGSKKLALLKVDWWLPLDVGIVSLVVDGIDFVRPKRNEKYFWKIRDKIARFEMHRKCCNEWKMQTLKCIDESQKCMYLWPVFDCV